MKLRTLELLVSEGESDGLEFKKSTGGLKGGMESLCGFLNGRGGQMLFGVTDAGAIVGQQISDRTLRDVAAEILHLDPPTPIEQIHIPAGRQEVLMLA
ncbi:MAG: ATP-binding protein, partial [Phycisphaerae bacterium]|nr:ATP-binding protein [Phycisphaerae bacterium]